MTPIEMQTLFHELNAIHFGKRLPNIRITINPKQKISWFRPGSGRLTKSSKLTPPHIEMAPKATSNEFRRVLIHELLHYFLWYRFKDLKKSINPYGHNTNFHKLEHECYLRDPILNPLTVHSSPTLSITLEAKPDA